MPDVDQKTWKKIRLRIAKQSGKELLVDLLRPQTWFEASGAKLHGTIYLDLPEMGVEGYAKVLSIGVLPVSREFLFFC